MERKQLEQALIKRAMEDNKFRGQLLSSPKSAIEEFTGLKLPEKLEIKILEETPTTIYLSIPSNELSDEELDGAAGGFCFYCPVFILPL